MVKREGLYKFVHIISENELRVSWMLPVMDNTEWEIDLFGFTDIVEGNEIGPFLDKIVITDAGNAVFDEDDMAVEDWNTLEEILDSAYRSYIEYRRQLAMGV